MVLYFVDWDGLWLPQPVLGFSSERLAQYVLAKEASFKCFFGFWMMTDTTRSPNVFVIACAFVFGGVWLVRLVAFGFEMRNIVATYILVSRKLEIADVRGNWSFELFICFSFTYASL
jgi:hypothetical protein